MMGRNHVASGALVGVLTLPLVDLELGYRTSLLKRSLLDPGTQYEYLRDFGFGTPTGVEYPAESSGRLPRPDRWSEVRAGALTEIPPVKPELSPVRTKVPAPAAVLLSERVSPPVILPGKWPVFFKKWEMRCR